jgi:hypothetical protein
MITQLNPPLPMVTPKGEGWAHFLIDYGPESALFWVVFMDTDGACWTVPNPEVRMYQNWTLGRGRSEDLKKPDGQAATGAAGTPAAQRFRPSLAHPSEG